MCLYLGVFIHSLLHVLQQVVVGSTLSLVDVDDAVQIGEVAIQVHSLCVTAAHKPILNLPRLGKEQETLKEMKGSETVFDINVFILSGASVALPNHLRSSFLKAVRVHGGHEVDAGVLDEVDDGLVAALVLVAQVLSQVDEQLSAHSLVAMHVGDVLKLRLTCRGKKTVLVVLLCHGRSSGIQ